MGKSATVTSFGAPPPVEVEKCDATIGDRAELYIAFIRRCLGTSAARPFVIDDTVINGASIAALSEAFAACCPLPKPVYE